MLSIWKPNSYLWLRNWSFNRVGVWCTPVHNILIRSGLFHTWFTPETCLKCMQIKNFTCGTRLNMPDRKFTPISCMKNFMYEKFHVWKISCMKNFMYENFTPDSGWNFSHQFKCENWVGFPRCRTVSRPITSTLSNTRWTNHIHQNNFDFLMKVALHFED